MAGSANVLEDNSSLSIFDKKLCKFEGFLALISGIAIFFLMILAVVSVSGRNLVNYPLPGYVDWIEQLMPLIAFMGISFIQRDGGHVRMDILIGRLKGRPLWGAELITSLAMLILMLLLIWGSYSHFLRSFDFNAPYWSRDSSIDISIPLWPTKLLAPVAFSILSLRIILQLWGFGRAFVLGLDRPIAVPLAKSAAAQAAEEAEHVGGIDGGSH